MSEEGSAFSEAAEALGAELRSAGHRVQTFPVPLRADDAAALNGCPADRHPRRPRRPEPYPASPRAA
jgi:hypothetical protein